MIDIVMLPKMENPIPYGEVPLKIQGKKSRIIGEIAFVVEEVLRNRRVARFVEPFAGTGAVGLAMFAFFNMRDRRTDKSQPQTVVNVISSDICEDFVKFYEFLDEIVAFGFAEKDGNWTLDAIKKQAVYAASMYSTLNEFNRFVRLDKNNFKKLREDYNKRKDNMDLQERALTFLGLNLMAFNGVVRFNKSGGLNVPFGKLISDVEGVVNGTDGVSGILPLAFMLARFEPDDYKYLGLPFEKTIELTDRPDTLFYCDPPYFERNTQYATQWKSEDQERFREMMLGTQGSFVVSSWNDANGSNDAELEKWTGCKFYGVPLRYMVGPKKENRPEIIEILIVRA